MSRLGGVVLTTTFLGLAAGGVAACDLTPDGTEETHRYYCTNREGVVVPEDHCDDDGDGHGGMFMIWHAVNSPANANLHAGQRVPAGGQSFPYSDRTQRAAWGLPTNGKIGNGTTRTNIVGKGGAPISGGGARGGGGKVGGGS